MKFLKMIPIIFIFLGFSSCMNLSHAESKNTNEYKVLSDTNKKLSILDVEDYLAEGDNLVNNSRFNKKNLRIESEVKTFKSLTEQLYQDSRVSDLEKCVILLQMFTFVGDDLYDENIKHYPGRCSRKDAEEFLIENASFIEY